MKIQGAGLSRNIATDLAGCIPEDGNHNIHRRKNVSSLQFHVSTFSCRAQSYRRKRAEEAGLFGGQEKELCAYMHFIHTLNQVWTLVLWSFCEGSEG